MKLALFSYHINENAREKIKSLLSKDVKNATLAFIRTAANAYTPDTINDVELPWLEENKKELELMGFKLTVVDLEAYVGDIKGLKDLLENFDVIYVSGGNSFYLMYYIKESGFDEVLIHLLKKGKVYIGMSAGSVIFNKDLSPISLVDEVDKAPEVIYKGIELLDFAVIPHWMNPKYQDKLEKIHEFYREDGLKTICINDNQGIIVNDLVGSLPVKFEIIF